MRQGDNRTRGLTDWRSAITLSAVMIGACNAPPEFTQPLADPGDFEVDRRLVGTWYGLSYCEQVAGEGNPCTSVGGPSALLTMLYVASSARRGELSVRTSAVAMNLSDFDEESREALAGRVIELRAMAYPATIGGTTYYSVRRQAGVGYDYTASGEEPHFIIVQPELADTDTLYLRLLWDPPLDQRTVDVIPEAHFSYSIVEEPRDRLAALLRLPDSEDSFSPRFGPFRRLEDSMQTAGLRTTACAPDEPRRAPRFLALAEVAKALASLGLSEEALDAARLALALDDVGVRGGQTSIASGLGHIAEAQALAGDFEASRATIARARRKDRDVWPDSSEALVNALARVGEFDEARVLIAALPSDYGPRIVIGDFAVILAQGGQRDAAIEYARRSGNVDSMLDVARAFRQRDDETSAAEALREAAFLADDVPIYLGAVAKQQVAWGDRDGARDTLQKAARRLDARPPDDDINLPGWGRSRLSLAEQQVQIGDLEGARSLVAPLFDRLKTTDLREKSPTWVTWASLERVIALQTRLGDRNDAQQMLDKVLAFWREQRDAVGVYYSIGMPALAYAAAGNISKAVETAEMLGAYMLYEIAAIRSGVSDEPGARQILALALARAQREIEARPDAAVSNVAGRARAHHAAGDDAAADFYLGLAVRDALAIQPPSASVSAMLEVASLRATLDDRDGARQVALQAFTLARALPELEACSSVPLLTLLGLPDLDGEK